MLELLIHRGPKTELVDSPFPVPNDDQVVIKVVVSGSNPKDWKRPEWFDVHINQGDDIAGLVHSVGKNVTEFKPGDRVAAFHEIMTPGGSYAEYGLAWAYTTFHIPKDISFEEAATIPLAGMTAALGLFSRLVLPDPWKDNRKQIPVLIYGGATAVGSFALKFATRANIHPLIVVAGGGASHVESLIDRSKGDTIVDYRQEPDALVEDIQTALRERGLAHLYHAFDTVCGRGSATNILRLVHPKGKAAFVLPIEGQLSAPPPPTLDVSETSVRSVHGQPGARPGDPDFGFVYFRYLGRGLAEKWFRGHPYQVRNDGLEGVEDALKDLKEGKASAAKYVFRIAETPALSREGKSGQ
ncbi:chaperonin 10-like protein [Penicillium hispanicum]|uniref:chaperonin 10-like protein n=1 Tax=Penicillium hispanicum TaxID=1080232 RepID=UPI00253FD50B|nr:chaperonin 10-like protein [Penicillium hispanicum]KAJ5593908.1 chaperonin 10-like protein [Penicillium hispanicum]